MELCNDEVSNNVELFKDQGDPFVITSTNWEIDNDKNLDECISTVSLAQAPDRTSLEDVVSLDTCVALKSDPAKESCKVDFKLMNKQKIARIAVVSEASVLEFFKQSGEYATTVFADFVDEFQDHSVYFAEAQIQPPASEASIKFTRTKSKGTAMWIYGIKLILTESILENSKNMFNLDIIHDFLNSSDHTKPESLEMAKKVLGSLGSSELNQSITDDMNSYLAKLTPMNWNSPKFHMNSKDSVNQTNSNPKAVSNGVSALQDSFDIKSYIDDKIANLEKRLMDRIELLDQNINQKFDAILSKLELNVNN